MAPRVMKRPARRVIVAVVCSGSLLGLFGLASCSLGLDESLIGAAPDGGGVDEASVIDQVVREGGDGALPPINPEAGVCAKDEDCKAATGCLAARCDIPRKACVLQVCRTAACNSASCDVPTAKCGAAKPYKYRAGQFPVGAAIGCGGALGRCFAAVYPFVFVGTTNGVVAFAASDPQAVAPPIPLAGLGFVPSQIVASGSRVYFLGTPVGAGATSRLPLAYADVPPNPFATKIPVTTVLGTYSRPASDPVVLFPRGNDTALLVDLSLASAYASTPIEPPLLEPAVFGSQSVVFTAASTPLATSGSRLVMGQITAASAALFGFVNAAGSASPTTTPDVAIPTATPVTGPQYFASSADGAIFWAHVSLAPPPIAPNPQLIRAAKGYFLVADEKAAFDPAAGIDLELYGVPVGTQTVGPAAMLDAKTALITTSLPANPALSNVGFVTRSPLAIMKNADNTPRRFQLTVPVSQLAAAGSNGLGYVLAVDPAAPAAPTVYVFDPVCAP